MKTLSVLLAALLISVSSLAQTWKSVGPDSVSWRSAVQMDVQFRQGVKPRIALATLKGIAQYSQGSWGYVLPDQTGIPFMSDDFFRSAYYSPFNDSVVFVGYDFMHPSMESGSSGRVIGNSFADPWQSFRSIGVGGFVGNSPSLQFVMSPHRTGKVYALIVQFARSSDNGMLWERIEVNSYGCYFLAADLKRDSVLYAGRRTSNVEGIYRSTDDGTTWNNIHQFNFSTFSGYNRHPFVDFCANGDTLIWSLSKLPYSLDSVCGIQVSVDRGATWSYVLRNINVQKFVRDEGRRNVFYAAAEGGIYRSTNSGMSWSLLFSNVPTPKLVDLRKDPFSDTLYVATRDSGVYKVADRTLEATASEPVPRSFELNQNFPNPFNPVTTITYFVGTYGHTSLWIFDLLGREITTLVNEVKQPGEYSVVWDASKLPSGVFFCRMAAGRFVATKQMILLK